MPDDQKLRLHYHDANVSADLKSPDNPLNTLKSVYKPGDYVVVKVRGTPSTLPVASDAMLRTWTQHLYVSHLSQNAICCTVTHNCSSSNMQLGIASVSVEPASGPLSSLCSSEGSKQSRYALSLSSNLILECRSCLTPSFAPA